MVESAGQEYRYYAERFTHTRRAAGNMVVKLQNTASLAVYVTTIDFGGSDLGNLFGIKSAFGGLHLEKFANLTSINLAHNTAMTGDIGSFVLPAALQNFDLTWGLGLTGDITDLTLPATLKYLNLLHCRQVTGDITGWALPTGLLIFDIHDITALFGDISAIVMPNTVQRLKFESTQVTGDITGWALPTGLLDFRAAGQLITGDVTGWVVPAGINDEFDFFNTDVTGNISAWVLPNTLVMFAADSNTISGTPSFGAGNKLTQYIHLANCGLVQADVDAMLAAIYAHRAEFTFATPALTIGGTNAAPSGILQNTTPPTTGKEYIYKLVNDPGGEGFSKWSISYTA